VRLSGGKEGRKEWKRHCVCCLFFPLIASDFADDQPLHSFQSFRLTSPSLLLSSSSSYWSGSTSLATGSGPSSLTVILFRVDCSLSSVLHLLSPYSFHILNCFALCGILQQFLHFFLPKKKHRLICSPGPEKDIYKKCVGKGFYCSARLFVLIAFFFSFLRNSRNCIHPSPRHRYKFTPKLFGPITTGIYHSRWPIDNKPSQPTRPTQHHNHRQSQQP